MTNVDIQLNAARCAALHTTFGTHLEADEAWQTWSEETGVHDPGARLLFEYEYAQCRRQSWWWQVLSGASNAAGWRRMLAFVRD